MNSQMAINELYKAFHALNDEFFDGELPEAQIVIMPKGKRNCYGWCTTTEIWSDTEGNLKKYEINLAAEFLNRPYLEIMRTLLHEMVHLWNAHIEVKDCSRSGNYHNKRFKAEAENRGMYFVTDKPDPKVGWSGAQLRPETMESIQSYLINPDAFVLARIEEGGGEKKSNSFKWICPSCETIIRSSKESIHVFCGDCGCQFEHDGGGRRRENAA